MNKTELKDLVKKYFNLTEINANNKLVFAEATLVDGTKVSNKMEGDFEVGQELYVHTEEGDVAAPSGEHTTESGIVVTVDQAGIITGIHHPDQEGEGSLEEMAKRKMAKRKMEEEIVDTVASEDLIEAISELVMPEIEEMKSEMTQCMARLAKAEEMMAKYEEKMSATPATQSKTTSKFSKQSNSILNSEGPKYNKRRYEMTLAQLTKR